ncbi:toprim domain-containing protein [Candidatus Vidania fulgoroideorum]
MNDEKKKFIICPYHKENNASMLIDKAKNYYHCFGCNTHGRIITKAIKKNIIYKYIKNIFNNNNKLLLLNLLKKRNFYDLNILKRYKLIYFDKINNIFSKREIFYLTNKKLLFMCNKKIFFYNRKLIIPIRSIFGKYVCFCIKNDPNKLPKYFFSKKIIYYKKTELIYGYHENKKYIDKEKEIYIVEGFFDLYRLNTINVNNSFSLLGCTISKFQIKFLIKLNKKIYFLFDNDNAGHSSYLKICIDFYNEIFLNKTIVLFTFIKKNDPDIFFLKYNFKKFKKYIKHNSINYLEFMLYKNNIFFKKNIVRNFFIKNYYYINRLIKNKKNKLFYLMFYKKNKINYLKTKLNKIVLIKKNIIIFLEKKKIFKKNSFNNFIKKFLCNKKNQKLNFYTKIIYFYLLYNKKLLNFISSNKYFFKNYLKKYSKIFKIYKKFIIKNEKHKKVT